MVTHIVSIFAFKKIMIFHFETKAEEKQFGWNSNLISLFFVVKLIFLPYRTSQKVSVKNADLLVEEFCRNMSISKKLLPGEKVERNHFNFYNFILIIVKCLVMSKYFLGF